MKKEFIMKDAKFVYTKNELAYQEVLDDFNNASRIIILTYNISNKQSMLLEKLKETRTDCEICIITNIPSRWETYYQENYRELAHKSIKTYMTKLEPSKFCNKLNTFFDFNNHGKIIMTENIVYVGSANFSEESTDNREVGFISKDTELIGYFKHELFPEIKNESIPYYEYDFTELLLEARMALLAIHTLKSDLHQATYSYDNHRGIESFYYDENKNDFSEKLRYSLITLSEESVSIANKICDAIDEITVCDETKTNISSNITEQLLNTQNALSDLCWDETIIDLSSFDLENRINEILQDDYSLEADEENLEFCIEKASETAYNELHSLNNDAKSTIDELLSDLKEFINILSNLIEYFKSFEIKKVNKLIDNT